MKNLILKIESNYLLAFLVIMGVLLIIFPETFTDLAPYIVGIALTIYAVYNLYVCLRFPEKHLYIGNSLIYLVIGLVLLIERDASIDQLGVIWAVRTLYESGIELSHMYRHREVWWVDLLEIVISTVLAFLLLMEPIHHFSFHVRILGLEILVSAFIHRPRLKFGKLFKES